jgi:DNA-binding NarL/FixJ family response regulator
MTIRIVVCDDQDVVTEGLQAILKTVPDFEVVAVAHDGAETLEKLAVIPADLVLMDLKMPFMNGIQATEKIRKEFPHIKVLVLTTYDADEWVFDAIRSGAAGYLLKDTPREDLVTAIRGTMSGKTHIDPGVAGKLFNRFAHSAPAPDSGLLKQLSERELEVLRLIAHGFSNADIAQRLYLSEGTVRNYVSGIFTKLGVSDRTQAAVIALRYGLADINEI